MPWNMCQNEGHTEVSRIGRWRTECQGRRPHMCMCVGNLSSTNCIIKYQRKQLLRNKKRIICGFVFLWLTVQEMPRDEIVGDLVSRTYNELCTTLHNNPSQWHYALHIATHALIRNKCLFCFFFFKQN